MPEREFEGRYEDWRHKRISFLEAIVGREYFRGKDLLEVGCGNGRTAQHFQSLGSKVTLTEGRDENILLATRINPQVEIHKIDHNQRWNLGKKFDIIIHWGLLYHLQDWKQDLECTINHLSDKSLLCLETEVLDGKQDGAEQVISEITACNDQGLTGYGIRTTAITIENYISSFGLICTRYDSPQLDFDVHQYSWEETNVEVFVAAKRRFWICWKGLE